MMVAGYSVRRAASSHGHGAAVVVQVPLLAMTIIEGRGFATGPGATRVEDGLYLIP